jgi:hypothetical protein
MSYRVALLFSLSTLGAFGFPSDSSEDGDKAPAASSKIQPERQPLEKARAANTGIYSTLKSFVCHEEIERYKGDLGGSKKRVIDHVSANLSFENGIEQYFDVLQNKNRRASMSAISGAWSEGEFGTLLQQTDKLLNVYPVAFVAFVDLADTPTAIYRFEVPEHESPWDLVVGAQHYLIPFSTDVWISIATGEILKIARKSLAIPLETRISEIDWDVAMSAVDLNGKKWLVPTEAAYSVTYGESKRREWNRMSFSNYHRYASESSLRFDGF